MKSGIFHSADFGQTWQPLAGAGAWRAAALAGDGNSLVVGARGEGSDPMLISPSVPGGHLFVTRAGPVATGAASVAP